MPQSPQWNDLVLQSISDCVLVISDDLSVEFANEAGRKFLQSLGTTDSSFFSLIKGTAVEREVRRASVEKTPGEFEFSYRDGELYAHRSFAAEGSVVLLFRQVKTTSTQAIKTSREVEAVIDQLPFSVQVVDPSGKTTRVNRAWERLWGVKLAALSDYNLLQDPQLVEKGIMPYIKRAFAGESVEVPPVPYVPDRGAFIGTARWTRAIIHPVFDQHNALSEVVLIHEDITERKSAEEEIRISEAHLRFITDHVPAWIVECDTNERFTFVNARYASRYGMTPEEIRGKHVSEVVGAAAYESFKHHVHAALRGETVTFDQLIPYDKLGKRWVTATYVPQKDQNGIVVGFVGVVEDITHRRESEEQIAFQAGLLDAVGEAVIATDLCGKVIFWNREAERLYGWTAGEAIGRDILSLTPTDLSREQAQQIFATLQKGETWSGEFSVRRADGRSFTAWVTDTPIQNVEGELIGIVGVSRDLTERKLAELKLQQAQDALARQAGALEELVQQRTASLKETAEQLETFCYTVAHDLRAPLRAQHGFAMALLEEYGLLLDDTGKNYLKRIIGAAEYQDRLVCDLLSYARVSRQELSFDKVDLGKVINDVIELFEEQITTSNAVVKKQTRYPAVVGHELTLKLAVQNLVSNALKFVEAGKHPRIRIWTELSGQTVRLFVQDNGIGIEPQYHEQIFGVFQRLDKSYAGTGIGLALVQKAITRMGGKVGLKSQPGRGSQFWIELPGAAKGKTSRKKALARKK